MFTIPPFTELRQQILSCTPADVEIALSSESCTLSNLCALLSPAAEDYLPQLGSRSKQITLERFGRTAQLYAPLYISNYCTNQCRYCGFSAENKINRRCLSREEVVTEANILLQRGFNHILLVSGESNKILGIDYLKTIATTLRDQFASISIEVQPLSTDEYRKLFEAGITGVAVYQETYDRDHYDKLHISGKKKDYDYRLETPERVGKAGMREIGIGALLGLSDWRCEGLALGIHLHQLRKKFWRSALTVSFPRLRPAKGEFTPLVNVSEQNLSQLIFALRIFDHDVGLVLSTREEKRYRDGMLGLGPTRYSAGSSTVPGGYAHPDLEGEQFSVGDHRSLSEVTEMMRQKGYDPVSKDWDREFQYASVN